MLRRKKIAIITPFLANGGAERVAITGAEWLGQHFDVTLIVMDSCQVDYPYDGKRVDMHLSLMNRSIPKRIYNMLLSVIRLRKLKKEHGFDLVISHGELANLPNILSGGKHNIVTVHENRFAALKDIQGKMVNRVIKYLYSFPSASKVVTVSEGIRQSLIEVLNLDAKKVQTIYNPYNIDEIKELSNASNEVTEMLSSNKVLATAGRLTLQKGQWFLLRIFHALKKKNPELKLVILGDGEMKTELVDFSEKLGLNTYTVWSGAQISEGYDVYFLGFQKNPYQYFKNTTMFSMTSLWEGFGNTIVEAMACGVPVISADCHSGPGEIILPEKIGLQQKHLPELGGYGALMPTFENRVLEAGDPLIESEKTWVDVLETLLDDQDKLELFSQKGLQRVDDFDQQVIMEEWQQLINTV